MADVERKLDCTKIIMPKDNKTSKRIRRQLEIL
jgi:hypothetical protein